MESLVKLIKSLKSKEVNLLRMQYKGQKENKKLRLLNLVLEDKVTENKEASELLCKEQHNSSLCQIKKRLEQDIYDILLLSNSEVKDECVKAELDCYKYLLLGKTLIYKGLLEEGLTIIERTCEKAEKHNLPQIKLSCYDILGPHKSSKVFGFNDLEYNQKIKESVESIQNILYAKSINYRFNSSKSSHCPCTASFQVPNETEISEIKGNNRATHWYTMALIHFHIQEDQLDKAKLIAAQLVQTLKQNTAGVNGFEVADFYLQLNKILLFLKEWNDALWAIESIIELGAGKSESPEILEFKILTYYRTNNTYKVNEVLETAKKGVDESHASKWNLWAAYLKFGEKKFKESNILLLSRCSNLEDKSSSLWGKLLELINILELEDYSWFEYKIESFRKRLQRYGGKNIERIKLIFHLLNTLRKNCFDYQETFIDEKEVIVKLQSSQKQVRWDPLGYEIIETSQWFMEKAMNCPARKLKKLMRPGVCKLNCVN